MSDVTRNRVFTSMYLLPVIYHAATQQREHSFIQSPVCKLLLHLLSQVIFCDTDSMA